MLRSPLVWSAPFRVPDLEARKGKLNGMPFNRKRPF